MDGGLTAIADVSRALAEVGAADEYRLIGGVTVMLHVRRLGLDLPLRATGDADFGVALHVLKGPRWSGSSKSAGTPGWPATAGSGRSMIVGSRP
jgi:hypothetical protein